MKKVQAVIPVARLVLNEGQLSWLPRNPRQWTKTDIDRTIKSIEEDPDFLEDRPVLVVPITEGDDEKFLVFGGNLRTKAAQKRKQKDMPCVIYYPELEEDRYIIKRRAAKDNGSFGSWDFDMLANEWDDLPLSDWGVPAWNTDADDDDMPTDLDAEPGAKPFVLKITFPTAEKMTAFVMAYKDVLEQDYGCTMSESGGAL